MTENSNQPKHDWGLYGVIIAVGGLLGLLVLADGRATRAEQKAEAARAEQRAEAVRGEQRAEAARAEQRAETEEQRAETARAQRGEEAEAIRRFVAEEIARANEQAAVNAVRIEHLEEVIERFPPYSPVN